MTKQDHKNKLKNEKRDALDNSLIGNHEVIKVDNAIDWVKKQGFVVAIPDSLAQIAGFFIMFLFLFSMIASFASAGLIDSKVTDGVLKEVYSPLVTDKYKEYPTITLKTDADKTEIATYKILSIECGFINCKMRIEVNLIKDNVIVFDNLVTAVDLKTNSNTFLNTKWYIKTGVVQVNDEQQTYKQVCSFNDVLKNNTCENVADKIIIVKRDVEQFSVYNNDMLKSGVHILELRAKIPLNSQIDVKPYYKNTEFSEWAIFSSNYHNNLTAYFSFNEGSGTIAYNNVSGRSNATFIGSPTRISAKFGNGLKFDGSAKAVKVDNDSSMNDGTNLATDYTFNFWFNYTNSPNGYRAIARDCGGSQNCVKYQMYTSSGSNDLAGTWGSGSAGSNNGGSYTMNGTGLNQWQMATFMINQTNTSIFYNGVLVKVFGIPSGTPTTLSSIPTCFGARGYTCDSQYYVGTLDEIAFWNRTLTSAEIIDLYNNGTGLFYEPIKQNYPKISFINATPQDINTLNIVSLGATFRYNITKGDNPINLSTVVLYSNTNSTSNNLDYINGSYYVGYHSQALTSNTTSVYTFNVDDNDVYPSTYNLNNILMENTQHSSFTSGANGVVKIELLNVSNTTAYNFYEIMVNKSSGVNLLTTYYCNSSYTTGNPSTSPLCASFATLTPRNTFNHSESIYSGHQLFSFTITNGYVGAVRVTPTSYFVSTANAWNFWYIPNTARLSAAATSINGGVGYTAQTYTLDAHLHQYNGNEVFYHFACVNDTSNNQNCTSIRSDNLDLSPLPPNQVNFYSPTTTEYNNTVLINYSASTSLTGQAIVGYDIALLTSGLSFIQAIQTNTSNLSYLFSSKYIQNGNYTIRVTAYDNLTQSSVSYSPTFMINHGYTDSYSYLDFDFNSTSQVLLFALIVFLNLLIYGFVDNHIGLIASFGISAILVYNGFWLFGIIYMIGAVGYYFNKE